MIPGSRHWVSDYVSFLRRQESRKETGCRIKSGMTLLVYFVAGEINTFISSNIAYSLLKLPVMAG